MNKFKAVIFLIVVVCLCLRAACAAAAPDKAKPADELRPYDSGAVSEKIRVRLGVTVDAFNLDAKASKTLAAKIESYVLSAILKYVDIVISGKNYDASLSVRFKTAAAFAGGEYDSLCAMSLAGAPAGGEGDPSVHELACFQMSELKKNCESAASLFAERVLMGVKAAKARQAAARAAEEKRRREERAAELKRQEEARAAEEKRRREEYAAALKKQEEARKAEEIKEWKKKKYEEWKSGRSMSILDEELEAAGISFERLIKEFKEMSASEK